MGKKFLELNKKMRLLAILKFTVLGIAAGMSVFAVVTIADKVAAKQPSYLFAVLIGAGVAIAVIASALAACYPTEKRIAKKLDERLGMNEKVQTMVEFKDKEGEMLSIQREDAERRLNETPKKHFKNNGAWINAAAAGLALVLLVTSLAIPIKTIAEDPGADVEGENDEWALDDWHVTAVRALIEEVKASEMAEDGRTEVVSLLETMLSDLSYIKSKAQMKQIVTSVMVRISGVADRINTFTAIINALRLSDSDYVKSFAEAIGSPADPIIESKYQSLKAMFKKETLGSRLEDFSKALDIAIEGAINVPKTDALYIGLTSYSSAIAEFNKNVSTLSDAEYESGLTSVFENSAGEISSALDAQNVNRATTDNANNRLMIIFGISWSELPEELKYPQNEEASTEDGDYDDKDDDLITGGGLGSGEVIYGSDDAVYDPNKGEHVNYGEVIDEYDAKKAAELDERPLDDDMKESIGDYFDSLYRKKEK